MFIKGWRHISTLKAAVLGHFKASGGASPALGGRNLTCMLIFDQSPAYWLNRQSSENADSSV